MSQDRWNSFTREELDAIDDGLTGEAELDPSEDPTFPRRIAVAERLRAQIKTIYGLIDG